MNSFEICSEVEKESLHILLPFLNSKKWFSGQLVSTSGQLFLQKVYGDFIGKLKDGTMRLIELKAEERFSPAGRNLFLESWSNRRWSTQGWMHTCQADVLFYHFVREDCLFSVDFAELQRWAIEDSNAFKRLKEKQQSKTRQANDTWGWIAPVSILEKELETFKTWHPQELLSQEEPQLS